MVGRLTSAEIDETNSLFYGTSTQTIKLPKNYRVPSTPQLTSSNGELPIDNKTIPKFDWIQQLDNITTIFGSKPLSNPQVQVGFCLKFSMKKKKQYLMVF